MMMATTEMTLRGSSTNTDGMNSMPTDTKKSTENESRNGSDSSAERWQRSDSRIIMPAKNAPRAKDTSNSLAEPYATPTAAAITHSVNNSRDPVRATSHSTLGNSRLPSTSIRVMNAATLAKVMPSVIHMLASAA